MSAGTDDRHELSGMQPERDMLQPPTDRDFLNVHGDAVNRPDLHQFSVHSIEHPGIGTDLDQVSSLERLENNRPAINERPRLGPVVRNPVLLGFRLPDEETMHHLDAGVRQDTGCSRGETPAEWQRLLPVGRQGNVPYRGVRKDRSRRRGHCGQTVSAGSPGEERLSQFGNLREPVQVQPAMLATAGRPGTALLAVRAEKQRFIHVRPSRNSGFHVNTASRVRSVASFFRSRALRPLIHPLRVITGLQLQVANPLRLEQQVVLGKTGLTHAPGGAGALDEAVFQREQNLASQRSGSDAFLAAVKVSGKFHFSANG